LILPKAGIANKDRFPAGRASCGKGSSRRQMLLGLQRHRKGRRIARLEAKPPQAWHFMPDIMSPEKRSRLMGRIKGRDTTPERYLGDLLKAAGIHFSSHDADLPGRPDFVFRKSRVAVFVDGDFWHGWRFPQWQAKLSEKWRAKIAANRARDSKNHRRLRAMGWRVLRIWEHQVERDAWACFERIIMILGRQRLSRRSARACYDALPRLKYRNRLPRVAK
jgi:DNA mismatch endonuclease (patch repair protein)